VSEQLVTRLLPNLVHKREQQFNVFSVMHHGTHEKQLSNVFAWLLDDEGTHQLGDAFQRIFLSEVNSKREVNGKRREPIPFSRYSVRQEVNTSEEGDDADIADLVLENDQWVLVVENYYTSSGHGHAYDRYIKFGRRGDKLSEVVLLCEYENTAEQTGGWKKAPVVTYSTLVDRLKTHVDNRAGVPYREQYPEQYSFLNQMQRRYGKGRPVDDQHVIEFINALCSTGEAGRYRDLPHESAAINFADHLREQALDRFMEGRELLSRVKQALRGYSIQTLKAHVNAAMGREYISDVSATFSGIYQWTVNFIATGEPEAVLQLKFGPSAWYANAGGRGDWGSDTWKETVPVDQADYTRLFITSPKALEIRQSAVTIAEVLGDLSFDDYRLRDEIIQLITEVG
jgi:hypothetical protein